MVSRRWMPTGVVVYGIAATLVHCGPSRERGRHPASPAAGSDAAAPLRAVHVAAGRAHVCALLEDGSARCWGDNRSGQLGDGTETSRSHPVLVHDLTNADGLSLGSSHSCAHRGRSRALRCWGDNGHGQLGDGSTENRFEPVDVVDLGETLSVSAGGHGTCARKPNGFVSCFGEVQEGGRVKAPTPVFGMSQTDAVAVGGFHACAILSSDPAASAANPAGTLTAGLGGRGDGRSGNVSCWGQNGMRQLGVPKAAARGLPSLVPELTATQLSMGHEHSCALTRDGKAVCWGAGLRCVPGEWFDGKKASVKPGAIGVDHAIAIAAGFDQACAITADKKVACTGLDAARAAHGDRSCVSTAVPGVHDVTEIALGDGFACALQSDRTVWCWGANDQGQLGDGTNQSRSAPVRVSSPLR